MGGRRGKSCGWIDLGFGRGVGSVLVQMYYRQICIEKNVAFEGCQPVRPPCLLGFVVLSWIVTDKVVLKTIMSLLRGSIRLHRIPSLCCA